MARIAVAQAARGQVKHTDEQGDEHVGLVARTGYLVDDLHDVAGVALVHGLATEERVDHSHHQR